MSDAVCTGPFVFLCDSWYSARYMMLGVGWFMPFVVASGVCHGSGSWLLYCMIVGLCVRL